MGLKRAKWLEGPIFFVSYTHIDHVCKIQPYHLISCSLFQFRYFFNGFSFLVVSTLTHAYKFMYYIFHFIYSECDTI